LIPQAKVDDPIARLLAGYGQLPEIPIVTDHAPLGTPCPLKQKGVVLALPPLFLHVLHIMSLLTQERHEARRDILVG